jgi:hypothetical protein
MSFAGKSVEEAVSAQLLQAIEIQTIDAAIEAAHRADERHRQERDALRLAVDQARYDAQLAGRRYERVDPDMRLGAAELEARWNAALERVREREGRLAAFDARTVASNRSMRACSMRSPRICQPSGMTRPRTCGSSNASSAS